MKEEIDSFELSNLSLADLIAMTQRWDIIQNKLTEKAGNILHDAVYREIERKAINLFK
jgi:hypothetical protein